MKRVIKIIFILLIIFFISYYLYSYITIKLSYKDIDILKDTDSKFIRIDNFNLHYKEYGNGDKTILLIHGFAASTFSFREIYTPLSKDYKVYAIDLPGFGLTERVSSKNLTFNPYSRSGQVEVVKRFLDKIGIKKVIILGHSMGGAVASYFTIKYPEYVEKLIIEDGAILNGIMGGGLLNFLKTPIGKFLWTPLVIIFINQISRLKDIAYYDSSIITDEVYYQYKKVLNVKNWDKGLYEIFVSQEKINLEEKLGEINAPTLIIWGEFDKVIPLDVGYNINKLIKNSKLEIIKNCGHVPHEEKPKEFLNIMVDFIENK
ncbi:MAG: alpha/beta hydrolase [Caldisericia bacterium]|nr:alpha/beta hydrolase [Caldisericia bacterium]